MLLLCALAVWFRVHTGVTVGIAGGMLDVRDAGAQRECVEDVVVRPVRVRGEDDAE